MAVKPSANTTAPEPVLLIIADISGYTRYMTANAKTLSHSQVIITELIEAIIREVELPLGVAKLEGDAVFLYCRKNTPDPSAPDPRRFIGEKLLTFFRLFHAKVAELSTSTTCTCNACAHIEKLRLKIIAHSGVALFHRVHNFTELAGLDVIIVHRLLKNSVKSDQYLLLTETARQDLEFPEAIPLTDGVETYEDIGRINTSLFLPEGSTAAVPDGSSATASFEKSWQLYRKLWFAPLARKSGAGEFRNVTATSGALAKKSLAALTLLLTPLMLPVGRFFVKRHAARALASQRKTTAAAPGCACGHHH